MPKLGDLLPKQVRRDLVDTIGEPAMTYPKVEFVHWMDREAQAIADEAVRRFPDQPDAQDKWYQDEIERLSHKVKQWRRHSRKIQRRNVQVRRAASG